MNGLMNRQIKFRAWHNNAKKYMSELCLYLDTGELGDVSECFHNLENKEDYVLEQFTGLTDKNGKEIYEGDIVRIYNNTLILANDQKESDAIHFVYWGHLGFQFTLVNGEYMQGCGRFSEPQYKVIGNIRENPVLLEK